MNLLKQYKRYLLYIIKKKINIDLDKKSSSDSLTNLFNYYGTDKVGHGYTQFYEKHFKPIKKKNLNILEIGSYSGASAASFVKYFPNSKIYCADINISNFKFLSKRIQVYGLDISNKKMINNFFKKINITYGQKYFDIIIDDGSHKLSDMLFSLNIFLKNLKKDGYYIIEDYKFPNFFERLNDPSELKIDQLINTINTKGEIKSNILDDNTKNTFKNNEIVISSYQGTSKGAAIVFFKKLN